MRKHLLAGTVALAALGSGASLVTAQGPAIPQLDFDVTKKAITLEGAPQIGTGHHRITLESKVKGEAGVALVKLHPGTTVEQFSAAVPKIKDPAEVEDHGSIVASTFWAAPSKYTTTIRLEDADYVFVDMSKKPVARMSFHAGPQSGDAGAEPPAPDAEVRLRNYRFDMPSKLKAGKQVLRTTNEDEVLHHALVMPLRKGVNGKKVAKAVRKGKEPRDAIGGPPSALVEIVSKDTTNDVEVNLRKGKYLFVCFLQDTPRSKPHAMLGMEKIVKVK